MQVKSVDTKPEWSYFTNADAMEKFTKLSLLSDILGLFYDVLNSST